MFLKNVFPEKRPQRKPRSPKSATQRGGSPGTTGRGGGGSRGLAWALYPAPSDSCSTKLGEKIRPCMHEAWVGPNTAHSPSKGKHQSRRPPEETPPPASWPPSLPQRLPPARANPTHRSRRSPGLRWGWLTGGAGCGADSGALRPLPAALKRPRQNGGSTRTTPSLLPPPAPSRPKWRRRRRAGAEPRASPRPLPIGRSGADARAAPSAIGALRRGGRGRAVP